MLKKNTDDYTLASEFPALRLVKTGRLVRTAGKITFVSLMLAIAAVFFVPWRQTAQGTGVVMAVDPQLRPQTVRSQTKGIVAEVKPDLREGSFVEQGEFLLRLEPFAEDAENQFNAQLIAQKAKLTAAESSLEFAKNNAIRQVESNARELVSLESDVDAAAEKVRQAEREYAVVKAELEDKLNIVAITRQSARPGLGIDSGQTLFTKEREAEAAKEKVAKAQAAVNEQELLLKAKKEKLKAAKEKFVIENQKAEQDVNDKQEKVQVAIKELNEIENKRGSTLDRLVVRAPRTGFIQQWNGLQGSDTVKEGDTLFVLVPMVDEMAVEMHVRGMDMPLIREGDPVRLQFDGWPAIQAVGWPSVAVNTFGGKVNRISPTDNGTGLFSVVIVPDKNFHRDKDWPDGRYLRQGVRANGWVLLNEVPLGFEIWRQLNGFPPVITDDKAEGEKEKGSKLKLPKP